MTGGDVTLYAGLLALGAWLGWRRSRKREEPPGRGVDLSVDSTAHQREIDALHAEFVAYLNQRGVPPEDELAQVFANWLANRTGSTVLARELRGDGIVIAIPDATEEE